MIDRKRLDREIYGVSPLAEFHKIHEDMESFRRFQEQLFRQMCMSLSMPEAILSPIDADTVNPFSILRQFETWFWFERIRSEKLVTIEPQRHRDHRGC